jgi:hypothetical protein
MINRGHVINIAFSLVVLVIIVCLTVLGDRIAGNYVYSGPGILFPPRSQAIYESSEFNFTSKINSMGFRDREYPIEKESAYRIITIGDSFTYGWGVEIDDVWSKILERELRRAGVDVEVLNLGRGGAYPASYAQVAKKAVPLLRPDLVIICVLQGDDLAQTIAHMEKNTWGDEKSPGSPVLSADWVMAKLYPNFSIMLKRERTHRTKSFWKKQAVRLYDSFNGKQEKRFDKLDPVIREYFLNGEIRPGLISISVKNPNYLMDIEDLNNDGVREGIRKMAEYFSVIMNLGNRYDSKVVVLSVPYRYYLCEEGIEDLAALGFNTDKGVIESGAADDAIKRAAELAGVEFFEFTVPFKAACGREKLFYKYDGHFTKAGNKLYAEAVFETVKDNLTKVRTFGGK